MLEGADLTGLSISANCEHRFVEALGKLGSGAMSNASKMLRSSVWVGQSATRVWNLAREIMT